MDFQSEWMWVIITQKFKVLYLYIDEQNIR